MVFCLFEEANPFVRNNPQQHQQHYFTFHDVAALKLSLLLQRPRTNTVPDDLWCQLETKQSRASHDKEVSAPDIPGQHHGQDWEVTSSYGPSSELT